jgi:hypothetical protein
MRGHGHETTSNGDCCSIRRSCSDSRRFPGDGEYWRGEYQFRTTVDPTQPTLFQRNAHLASARMPAPDFLLLAFYFLPIHLEPFDLLRFNFIESYLYGFWG